MVVPPGSRSRQRVEYRVRHAQHPAGRHHAQLQRGATAARRQPRAARAAAAAARHPAPVLLPTGPHCHVRSFCAWRK